MRAGKLQTFVDVCQGYRVLFDGPMPKSHPKPQRTPTVPKPDIETQATTAALTKTKTLRPNAWAMKAQSPDLYSSSFLQRCSMHQETLIN